MSSLFIAVCVLLAPAVFVESSRCHYPPRMSGKARYQDKQKTIDYHFNIDIPRKLALFRKMNVTDDWIYYDLNYDKRYMYTNNKENYGCSYGKIRGYGSVYFPIVDPAKDVLKESNTIGDNSQYAHYVKEGLASVFVTTSPKNETICYPAKGDLILVRRRGNPTEGGAWPIFYTYSSVIDSIADDTLYAMDLSNCILYDH